MWSGEPQAGLLPSCPLALLALFRLALGLCSAPSPGSYASAPSPKPEAVQGARQGIWAIQTPELPRWRYVAIVSGQ